MEFSGDEWTFVLGKKKERRFEGEGARKVAGVVVSRINRSGARKGAIQDAVRLLDELGSPEAVLRAAAQAPRVTRPGVLAFYIVSFHLYSGPPQAIRH